MKIEIRRTYKEKQTESTLYLYNERNGIDFSCFSLELPWEDNQRRISCIPEGVYKAILHTSPRFGECLWIQDVKDRSEILIHAANYVGSNNPNTGKPDLLGCIAPGLDFLDITNDGIKEVVQSKKALGIILNRVSKYLLVNHFIEIEIIEET